MYFTTKDIWDKLDQRKMLPKSWDPEKIIKQNYRYFQRFTALNSGIEMNHLTIWNNFEQMIRDHFRYLKAKKEKRVHMKKIDEII